MEILRADRTKGKGACNECIGRGMFACLENGGVVECYFPNKGTTERNAALFAAAPELYEACKALLESQALAVGIIEHDEDLLGAGHSENDCALCMARRALAHAEGKSCNGDCLGCEELNSPYCTEGK